MDKNSGYLKIFKEISEDDSLDRKTKNFKQVSILAKYTAPMGWSMIIGFIAYVLANPRLGTATFTSFGTDTITIIALSSFWETYWYPIIILSIVPVFLFCGLFLAHLANQAPSTKRDWTGGFVLSFILFYILFALVSPAILYQIL